MYIEDEIRGEFTIELYKNPLTPGDANDFIGRVFSQGTIDLPRLCKSAAGRGGAEISAETIQHGVELLMEEAAFQLCNGFSVNIGGYLTGRVAIKGKFNGPNDRFDPGRHHIFFEFRQGFLMRKLLSMIKVHLRGVAGKSTQVLGVEDRETQSKNDRLSPGGLLNVSGRNIKIAGEDPGTGIYFVDEITGARVKVEGKQIAVNNPSKLILQVPNLPNGSYRLEIVTQSTGNSGIALKAPRRVELEHTLTVGSS